MRRLRTLQLLLGVAVVSSLVHYTDNYLAFEVYPQNDSFRISDDVIWVSWVAYTAFGLAGYLLYRRGRLQAASVSLAVYSMSGLISLGHYSAAGMSQVEWWRHVSIWIDISLGAAILAFAVRTALRERVAA